MTKLTVVCPSRARPDKAQAVFDSFMDTRRTDRATLHFAVDQDDATAAKYPPLTHRYPSHSAVEALNQALGKVTTDYIGFIGDDNRFVTDGWDERVLAALDEQGGGVVYANDLMVPGSLPTVCFMSTAICRAVGYFALPALRINYFDNVWKDLGEGVGKYTYLPDVAVQHLSLPRWWAAQEQGERHEREVSKDRARYLCWVQTQRDEDVARARAATA